MSPWSINPNPFGNVALSALVAAVPIAFLFVALAVLRMKGHVTSILAMLVAVAVAVFAFGMPVSLAAKVTALGVLYGIWPIFWIVITAVFLYNLSVKTGQFEIIKNSLASITDDRRLQALLIAFSFGAFLEGAAGFGTPVAISAAMLVGLGFNPLYAAGICLLANTAPVAFGAIGIPIVVAGQTSGIDANAISAMVGRTLPFLSIAIPFYLVILMSGLKKGLEVWPAALVSGASFAIAQYLTSNFLGPLLPDIIASIVSIVCLTVFLQVWHPAKSWRFANEPPSTGKEKLRYTGGQVFRAWAPFLILSIFVGAWGVKPIQAFLNQTLLIKFDIPGLAGMILRDGKPAVSATFSFNVLSAAGTSILLAAIVSLPVMGASVGLAAKTFVETAKTLRFAAMSIAAVLGFGYVINYGGMVNALGNAFAATGPIFPFVAPFLGWLGVLVTGSDTSANALFARLQVVTATKLGIDPVITVAANSSGGVCGKMISPQSLSVGCAAVGLVNKESDLFRFTFKHSLILTAVIGVLVFLQSNILGFLVPTYDRVAAAAAGAVDTHAGMLYLAGTAVLIAILALIAVVKGRSPVREPQEAVKRAA